LAGYDVKTNKFKENTQVLSVLYVVAVRLGIYASMYGSVTDREKSNFSGIFNQNIEFMPTTLPPPPCWVFEIMKQEFFWRGDSVIA
jgi:hypothetical protein